MSNVYANSSRRRAAKRNNPEFVQGPLDRLETPAEVTEALLRHVQLQDRILEPAAGSGRIVRVLRRRRPEPSVFKTDLQQGRKFDFLSPSYAEEVLGSATFAGDLVTNPPYSGGRAEAFVAKALQVADGRVCMLLRSGFLWGTRRATSVWREGVRPELVLVIPWRIRFLAADGKPIAGQFYDHAWFVWAPRSVRSRTRATRIEVASPEGNERQRLWLKDHD